MEFIKEFWEFITTRKKYWLLPIIIVLAIVGSVLVVGEGSTLTPLIYAIF